MSLGEVYIQKLCVRNLVTCARIARHSIPKGRAQGKHELWVWGYSEGCYQDKELIEEVQVISGLTILSFKLSLRGGPHSGCTWTISVGTELSPG